MDMNPDLDKRLNVFRPDLADSTLKGQVDAQRFVDGEIFQVTWPVLPLYRSPGEDAPRDSEILFGDHIKCFERSGSWAWVQSVRDSYVGYAPVSGIGPTTSMPNAIITAPRTFIYKEPDLKSPMRQMLSIGTELAIVETVERRGTQYAVLADGTALIANHIRSFNDRPTDYVSVAEQLLYTPYLWGGASGFGLDCSALVQISAHVCGQKLPRDSDMLFASFTTELTSPDELQRGDLVFWNGHVGMMSDRATLLHANGHTMNTAREPLADAISRIGYLYNQPIGYRRPDF